MGNKGQRGRERRREEKMAGNPHRQSAFSLDSNHYNVESVESLQKKKKKMMNIIFVIMQ